MGVETVLDASDFLFWGYEDKDLTPCGIYDIMTDKVTIYEHIDRPVSHVDSETIRQFAVEYSKQICQRVAL